MKRAALMVVAVSSILWLGGCGRARSADGSAEISPWVRLKAALSARFTNGKTALQQASDAKAAAKSYKMRVEMRLHPGDPFITEEEVACPDRIRMSATLGSRPMYDAVRIGGTSYVKDPQNKWVTSPVPADVYPCGSNPGAPAPWAILNEGRDMSSALAQLVNRANATVSVGNLISVNGSPCQEWEIEFGHPGSKQAGQHGGNMRYTECVDTGTHLPVQVVMGSGGIVVKYYDWNLPVEVKAPVT
jgi:hypothetical protein